MRVPPISGRGFAALALAAVVAACQSGPTPTSPPPSPTSATVGPSGTPAVVPSGGLSADEVFDQVSPSVAFVQTRIANGSGFVIDDRHVVTNAHVVRPAAAATIRFADGTEFVDAPVVGWDLLADLAVLEVPRSATRPAIPLPDGEAPRTGTRVYLVGYPQADRAKPAVTITEGIISGAAFEWVDSLTYHQTDAVIDFGQSGGALVGAAGELLGVTSGVRGQFAVALDGRDALNRVRNVLDGANVDGMTDRVLPTPGDNGRKAFDLTFRHRADMHAWLVPATEGDPTVHVSVTSTEDVRLVALAAAGRLNHGAGPPAGKLAVDMDFDAPGPYLIAVEPDRTTPAKVHLRSTTGLTHFDDPDDGGALVIGRPWMGAADYAGDIDWYTLRLSAGDSVTIRASAAAMDPALFVDLAGSATTVPLATGHDAGGPLGGDDELEFRAPKAADYLVVVSDLRFTGAGAYRLTVTRS
jgi:trypsin-like peptidase